MDIRCSVWLMAVFLTFATSSHNADAQQASPTGPLGITVRVYNYAKIHSDRLERAQRSASEILKEAGFRVSWIHCPYCEEERSQYPDCPDQVGPDDIFLKIMPRIDMKKNGYGEVAFGFTAGRNIMISTERPDDIAQNSEQTCSRIIVLAVAHEIGHALMGTNTHSSRGIMRARWYPKDLQEESRYPAYFTEEQIDRMHRNWTAAQVAAQLNLGMKVRNRPAEESIPFASREMKEPRTARDYFERGLARARAGDSSGAIEDFTNAIALNSYARAPKRARHPKSELDNRGQPILYEKFLVIDKFNALVYFNIGTLLMKQGRLSEAIDNLSKAIKLHPRFWQAFNNRGHVKRLRGDIDGATKDYNRSVQLDPKNSNAYYSRAMFRQEIQDFAGAIADHTRAIEFNPQIAGVFHDRGCAYLALAKLDEAHRDFDRAIELNPELFVAYGNRGLVRILQGRDAEADADLAHYLRYAGDNKDTLEALVRKARELRRANGVKAWGNLPVIAP